MDWIWIIILIAVIVAFKIRDYKNTQQGSAAEETTTPKADYSKSYQQKYLLTKNEYREYMTLRQIADKHNLIICPKVRLLDIIEPRKGEKNYQVLFNKIQSKHIDFVICDQDLHIKAILELDDNSHNQKNRQERDAFVDQILASVGYKVIHTHAVTETTLESITEPTTKEEINDIT